MSYERRIFRITIFLAALFLANSTATQVWSQEKKPAPTIFYFCGDCNFAWFFREQSMLNTLYPNQGIYVYNVLDKNSKGEEWGPQRYNHKNQPNAVRLGSKVVKDKSQAKKQILKYLMSLDKTKPLIIYLNNHGDNGDGSSPFVTGPVLAGIDDEHAVILTITDWEELFEKANLVGANKPPLRIIGSYCFSGGLHEIAKKYPNVTAISASSATTPATKQFAEDFLETVIHAHNHNTPITFREAFTLSGSRSQDSANRRRDNSRFARLSSMAYAEGILIAKGKIQEDKPIETFSEFLDSVGKIEESFRVSCTDQQAVMFDNTFKGPVHSTTENKICTYDNKGLTDQLESIRGIISKLPQSKTALIPKVYLDALEKLKANETNNTKLLAAYREQAAKVKKQWDEMPRAEREKKAALWVQAFHKYGEPGRYDPEETQPDQKKLLDALKSEPALVELYKLGQVQDLKDYFYQLFLYQELRSLIDFFNVASEEEMRKFSQLSELEDTPL